ncbi:trafficking protein particle complex subunit 4-like [Lolium rigidum]|uniref:trafficking protein particle complex subunit 4-like n=1 Tax=Lolium rigidum TaxID=89674 RepID=UPI001F5E1E62|nr:trafficking protein particle complex subunit 4-like [Lolium rigidum]
MATMRGTRGGDAVLELFCRRGVVPSNDDAELLRSGDVRGGESATTCPSSQDYGSAGRMDTNDSLRLASLWHSMHAISQQLSPTTGCTGIDLLQANNFDLHCFQSLTGTKFFVVCETGAQNMEILLKTIYELYTEFVLKNPFYEMEMPIRCELFDLNLAQVIQKDRVALMGR